MAKYPFEARFAAEGAKGVAHGGAHRSSCDGREDARGPRR
jgi:hypothetical protein